MSTVEVEVVGKYRPYSEYKDSGVEWLGDIPHHWSVYSLKRSVAGCTNGIWGDEPDGENDLIVLRVADFDRDKLLISDHKLTYRSISERERRPRLLKKGDLLIEKSGGGEKTLVGCVVLFDKDYAAVTSNFVAKMSPHDGFHSGFLNYAFSHLYSGRINYPSIKQTTGIQNLDSESYLMERFCFPEWSEQRTIAAFLDYETARIDRLIAQQQRLIELLKEKRQAVISHAVTKGLNPDAQMKESGVEWLGQVPEHWSISQPRYLCRFVGGGTPSKDNFAFWNGDIPWVSPKDMKQDLVRDSIDKITEEAVLASSVNLIPSGSILMVVRGMILAHSVPVALTTRTVTINQDMKAMVVDRRRLNGTFWLRHLQGIKNVLLDLTESSAHGTKCLRSEGFEKLSVPIPPLDEQLHIVNYLTSTLDRIDKTHDKANKLIRLAGERRTALISAAVTGKIDLRGWTPLADEVAA